MQHEISSCLDYPVMHCTVTAQVLATWQAAPADHARVQVTLDLPTGDARRNAGDDHTTNADLETDKLRRRKRRH